MVQEEWPGQVESMKAIELIHHFYLAVQLKVYRQCSPSQKGRRMNERNSTPKLDTKGK
jgi:hypothetical protein